MEGLCPVANLIAGLRRLEKKHPEQGRLAFLRNPPGVGVPTLAGMYRHVGASRSSSLGLKQNVKIATFVGVGGLPYTEDPVPDASDRPVDPALPAAEVKLRPAYHWPLFDLAGLLRIDPSVSAILGRGKTRRSSLLPNCGSGRPPVGPSPKPEPESWTHSNAREFCPESRSRRAVVNQRTGQPRERWKLPRTVETAECMSSRISSPTDSCSTLLLGCLGHLGPSALLSKSEELAILPSGVSVRGKPIRLLPRCHTSR